MKSCLWERITNKQSKEFKTKSHNLYLEILLSQHGQQARQILWRALGIEANAQRQSDTTSVPKKAKKALDMTKLSNDVTVSYL